MDFCSGCGQYFVNEQDLSFHECFVFRYKIKGLKYNISYNVAVIMLFALHIAINKKPIGKSLQWAFYLSMLLGSQRAEKCI